MSNFVAGKTYKLSNFVAAFIATTLQAQYKDEQGVFTVHQLDADGSAWTDDITSTVLPERCHIPAHIADECEEVADAS
jgi:hypothetical protein